MRHPLVLAAIRRAPVRFYGPQSGWIDGHITAAFPNVKKATVMVGGRHYHGVPFQNLYLKETA